jgi:hypothetical protein
LLSAQSKLNLLNGVQLRFHDYVRQLAQEMLVNAG